MTKTQAIQVLADFFKCPPKANHIAKHLGYTEPTVYQWPDVLTKAILHGIAGRLVGRRLPKELIEAIKGAK